MTARGVAARAGLVLGGLLLAALLMEGALRILGIGEPSNYLLQTRTFAERLLERPGGDSALPHVPKASTASEIGGIDYHFDRHRLRAGVTDWAEASRLAVGDSVTMGWGVAAEEAWPERLESPALNGGVLGYGIGDVAARAQALVAVRGTVDTVLVGYYPNDAEATEDNVGADVGMGGSYLWRLLKRVFASGPTAVERYRALHAEGGEGLARVAAGLDALAALRRFDGRTIRVVVLLLPALEAVEGDTYALTDVHQRVAVMARERGLDVIDVAPVIAELARGDGGIPARWVARDDPHPDAVAHQAYATFIERALSGASSQP